MTRRQRKLVVDHIAVCEHCADLYEALCDANTALWKEAAEALGLPKLEPREPHSPEVALADLWRRIDADEVQQRRRQYRASLLRIGSVAAAACIIIAVGIGRLTLSDAAPSRSTVATAPNPDETPDAVPELVTNHGAKPLPLGEPVATVDRPQEILLGGMHRVVMNRNTEAIFSAPTALSQSSSREQEKTHYVIQLAHGELCVEVIPSHPFTVTTRNARLDITGTRFNVLADGDKTELTLLKGSVRFSPLGRPKQAVSVKAGYACTITKRLPPSLPAPVDPLAITAWAREDVLDPVAMGNPHEDVTEPVIGIEEHTRLPDSPDVETLAYAAWRDAHQELRLAFSSLARQPANTDWIDVLMISGDIWQFHYDRTLLADQAITKIELPPHTQALGLLYAEALRRWHDAVTSAGSQEPEDNAGLKIFSLRATHYLADTRTAAYLWVKTHPQEARHLLADNSYLRMLPVQPENANVNDWISQLREQATAARRSVSAATDWLLAHTEAVCAPEPSEHQSKLAEGITKLMPPSPDQPEGQDQ